MGNACCEDQMRPRKDLGQITMEQGIVSNSKQDKDNLIRKYSVIRSQASSLHINNNKAQEQIKRLQRWNLAKLKLWKLKHPYSLIYCNKEQRNQDQLPKGDVKIYKFKESGEFAGFFEGRLNENYQPDLKGSLFVYHNGSYFVGTGQNQGVYTNDSTNLKYEGGWENEQPHGNGKESNNKGIYQGSYVNGQKHGQGKFVWNNGSTYEGNFEKGSFHGKGAFVDHEAKTSYHGEYCRDLKHGLGIEKRPKQIYDGEFFKNKRCGHGKLTVFADDENTKVKYIYEGMFQKNEPHGKGTYSEQASGRIITGIWEMGALISEL